ncbi:MAG: site-specific DNA-methyltransferase [candidate division Zixibacteria bacterium]|nr:site-specific DNA-methyltransferase [candidate division Zixibacteria bacterium]
MTDVAAVERIGDEISALEGEFNRQIQIRPELSRKLVSFQANKEIPGYRWFRYKEGFSAPLIERIIVDLEITKGRVLDPFAGSGVTLFVGCSKGLDATGIELLPVGCELIRVRKAVMQAADKAALAGAVTKFRKLAHWKDLAPKSVFPHVRITEGAFPPVSERKLCAYLEDVDEVDDPLVKSLLRFAAMCVLEEISFTRKDGQYLRWDYRSPRGNGGRPFDKGTIKPFDDAIDHKLAQIVDDLSNSADLFGNSALGSLNGNLDLFEGSCLSVLPKLHGLEFDAVITSPPYCNRYDYTRTYALELAFLGIANEPLKTLRQTMLTCTVENRPKTDLDSQISAELLQRVRHAVSQQSALNAILDYIDDRKSGGLLNNNGIPRMIRNYFLELSIVVAEIGESLKPGAPFVMINDNVRYEGVEVPVDLILSDIAKAFGYDVDAIWVLPVGKGNSSQQMGAHGREELRKCVYVWRKAKARSAKKSKRESALQKSG